MSGSAVASPKLNVVTPQMANLAPMVEPLSSSAILDTAPALAQHRPGPQAMPSFSWAKLGLVGFAGWGVVIALGYGIFHLL